MNNTTPISHPLHKYFTSDAWTQFSSYLETLKTDLNQYQIPNDDIASTLDGIAEYVKGFHAELGGDTKIIFRQALQLIDEIGSPHEIIQDLQLLHMKEPTAADVIIDTKHCNECGARLDENEIYCSYCGRNTTVETRQFSPVKQKMIDHPYITGFVGTFGTAFLLTIIATIIILIGVFQGYEISISMNFGFVLLVTIVLSVIAAIIGMVISSIYRDYVSFNQRYNRLKTDIDGNFILAHMILTIDIFAYVMIGIFHRNALIGSYEGNPSSFILILISLTYLPLVLALREDPTPEELSYYELLLIKNQISHRIRHRLIAFNKIAIMPLIIVSGGWHYLIYEPLALDSAYFAIPGYLMFVLLFVAANAIHYAYQHSWSTIQQMS